jgi:hypothetical protein
MLVKTMLVKTELFVVQTYMEIIIVFVPRGSEESSVRLTTMIVYRRHAKILLCVKIKSMTMNVNAANLELLENTVNTVKVISRSASTDAQTVAYVGETLPQL